MGRNRHSMEKKEKPLVTVEESSDVETKVIGSRVDLPYTIPMEVNMKEVKSGSLYIDLYNEPHSGDLKLHFDAANVKWEWRSVLMENENVACTLECKTGTKSNLWKISTHISVFFKETGEDPTNRNEKQFFEKLFRDQIFDENNTKLEFSLHREEWEHLRIRTFEDQEFIESAEMTVEVQICVNQILGLKSKRQIAFDLSDPTTETDVIFKFGEKLLYMNCSYLAMYSEYFSILHSRLAEIETKDSNGLPIQKMEEDFKEFQELMEVVYPSKKEISDSNVEYILTLADRFTLDATLVDCEKFLINKSENIDVFTKLHWASMYYLTDLQDHCLFKFTSRSSITAALKSPIFPSLSLEVVTLLFKLLAEKRD